MIATSGQAKVAYDVTGGGNDDRPPVSLARGPITVLSADLRVAAVSVERIIRRLLVYEGRRQPGTPRQGRPPGCPPGLRESDRQVGPPAVRVASELAVSPVWFPPSGDRLASQLVSSEQSSRTNGGGELHRAERQGKLTRGGRWRHRNVVVESPAYRSAASS